MKYKISIVNCQLSIILLLFFVLSAKAQVTIGKDSIPHIFSMLELRADKVQGGLRLPQLTTGQITAIGATLLGNPSDALDAKGLVVYDTSLDCLDFWNGATWISLCDNPPCLMPNLGTIINDACTSIYSVRINATITIHVEPVPGVFSYKWTVPSDWEIIDGIGTNKIIVTTGSTPDPNSTVSVAATNGFCTGPVSSVVFNLRATAPACP